MRRKWLLGTAAVPLILLTSCVFVLQGFIVLDGTLNPGDTTKARFILRPINTDRERVYQFVVVGVDDGGDLTVGGARWGTNGTFGGPRKMPVSGGLPAAMTTADTCEASGFDFATVTNTTWKAFILQVRTRGTVDQKANLEVVVKATPGATPGNAPTIIGVTGIWVDDGDTIVNATDSFFCTGVGTSNVYVS